MAKERRTEPGRGRAIAAIIILLVLIALAWFVGRPVLQGMLPSREHVDLRGYLGLFGAEDAAVMLGENRSSGDAIVRGGNIYWDLGNVKRNFSNKFWANLDEGILLFTTADEVVRAEAGELFYTRHAEAVPSGGVEPEMVRTEMPVFFIERGRGYVALEYAKQFSNFTYDFFKDPYRVQIYARDGSYKSAALLKNTVLRKAGDKKSAVVSELSKDDTVFILTPMGDWSKVRTKDALIGFVENRYLPEEKTSFEVVIPQDYTPPPYTALTEDRLICLGWHQVSVADANAYLDDMVDPAWPLDVVSPTWYSIADGSGTVNSIAWQSYVERAHGRGLEVWPLVDDFADGLDRVELLMTTASRDNFVSYMIAQAEELGFDGINLDFEVVPLEAASGFEQLVRELSVACRAYGLVFSIDNYPPRAHTEHYNRGLQGEVADYVIIMGYDEHWGSSSGAGSVASLPFVTDAIERTLSVVPAKKTINAVPFYTRIWSTSHEDGSVRVEATVGQKSQDEWVARRELEPIWSEELGQNYTQIDENKRTYQVWLENEASMQTRIDAMKGYGLGGVACWRLGLEPANIWDILGEYTRG